MKRILCVLTAFVMILSMVPAVSLAAQVRTVYVDPVSGADTNSGLTEAAPVKSLETAYAALAGADEGILILLDTLTLTEATTFPACDIPVTVTSATGAEGITAGNHIFFAGDTTLEDLTLTLTASNNTTYLSSEGHDLTIGEDVTCAATDSSSRFSLTTRYGEGSVDGAVLTVKSGNWRNIFVAGYKSANTGDATLIMTGGNVNNLLAPSYSGTLTGNVTMDISGATVTCVCAAPNETGAVNGNVDITLGDGVSGKLRVKRLYKNAAVNGTATVTIDGDCSGLTGILHEGPGSGSITETRLVLKSGVLDVTPCTFDNVSVEIPTGKTLTLSGCDVTADTVNSAGTLIFSGAASLTADAITGSLNCQISGTPEEGHTYVTAPAGSAVTFPEDSGITETDGLWQSAGAFDESTFQGLVIRAEKDVSVTLYSNYKAGTGEKQTPTHTIEGENLISYYYAGASGAYRCVTSRSGYYKLTKNIYISPAEAATCTEHIVQMEKRAGGTATDSWEPVSYQNYTDEMLAMEAFNDDISQWPEYADVFTTPWFTEDHAAQQQTTQEQLEKFIFDMDDENDNMYIFSIGKSGSYGHDIWAIFYTETDLSSATTAQEAAALMGQDKPTVMYRALIHGNEPTASEAALAVAQRLDGVYGDSLVENINIVMVPRANPDGAQTFTRTLASGVDANRDMLRVESQEIADYLKLYQWVEPEMVIDGHEYDGSVGSNYITDSDITAGAGFTTGNTAAYQQQSIDLLQDVFDAAEENGLTYRYYNNQLNSDNANISRPYFGQQGCLSFLLETRGNGTALVSYARRIVTQVISVEVLLDYASDNAQAMQALVDAEKQYITEKGKTYRSDDLVPLSTVAVSDANYSLDVKRIYQNGTETVVTIEPGVFTDVQRSRVAPTAYVIPAGAAFTEQVLARMDKHGISYRYIPAGATVQLQQYTGTATEAGLTEETAVTFGKGAYVFCMDQVKGITLSMLMEPDVTDLAAYKGTFAQQGVITPVGGYFPIYRYCHDLNADGFIDYTLSDVEEVHATVYLDGTNGLDTNDGLTEETAVKTLEQAYAAMAAALNTGGEGSDGTLVVIGLYDLGAQQTNLPAVGFPVTITGKTSSDGFSFTGGSTQAERTLEIHSQTTFRDMTLHINNTQTFNYIFGNGHKLTIGEGVSNTSKNGNCYFIISGGDYEYTDSNTSTDLTIRSGSWRSVYAGGYRASVTGQVKADISGCWVYNNIATTYCGNIGSAQITISNVEVADVLVSSKQSAIYCGPVAYNSSHKVGSVGDVTVTLGENIKAHAVYAGSQERGNVTGTATLIADGIDLSAVPVYGTANSASPGTVNKAVLRLGRSVACDITVDPNFILDLNGCDITGNVTVDGTLMVYDSATDDYTVADGVCGEITGTVTGTLVAKDGYIAAANGFHKFDQYISGVSLRPSNAGIYYSATILCDEVLAAEIEACGVAVSLADLPGSDFETDEDTLYSTSKYGVMIDNILKGEADDADRAIMDIYAAGYVKFSDGTVLVTDNEIAYSLYDVLLLLQEQAPEAFESFCATHKIENWF